MLAFCIITRMLSDIISFLPGDGSTLKCTSLMRIKQFSKLSWGFWPGRYFWSCYECLRSAACRWQFLIFPPPFGLCCSTLNLLSAYLFHRTWPASVTGDPELLSPQWASFLGAGWIHHLHDPSCRTEAMDGRVTYTRTEDALCGRALYVGQ